MQIKLKSALGSAPHISRRGIGSKIQGRASGRETDRERERPLSFGIEFYYLLRAFGTYARTVTAGARGDGIRDVQY